MSWQSCEQIAREYLGRRYECEVAKQEIVIPPDITHIFDCYNEARILFAEVKSNSINRTDGKPDGRYWTAIRHAVALDLILLDKCRDGTKHMILFNQRLFILVRSDLSKLFPKINITLLNEHGELLDEQNAI
ncbi:MAG: hypothetical protein NTX50_12325 [Candidatus Sumerlaeota bacterium]|nr:hypothetical protein [Candidatus Sumerlaeota bacterium]